MSELPGDVTRFLDEHIESVMQLEVLLALRTATGAVSARQLMRSIGGSVDQVLLCILELERAGLVRQEEDEADVCASYAATGATEQAVAKVAAEYGKRKVRVIAHVLRDRSRSPLDDFSQAFRLRPRGED